MKKQKKVEGEIILYTLFPWEEEFSLQCQPVHASWGLGTTGQAAEPASFLATALDAGSCVPLHHLEALLERDFEA